MKEKLTGQHIFWICLFSVVAVAAFIAFAIAYGWAGITLLCDGIEAHQNGLGFFEGAWKSGAGVAVLSGFIPVASRLSA